MRVFGLTIIILFSVFSLQSQTTAPNVAVDLPAILPASPEPSSFVKAGVGIVNLSTGMASANIPLYDIRIRDFSFPISISYSTQGLKTDEVSSRVGLGWVLNATGMITRSVRGKPDEQSQHESPPADFNAVTNQVYSYCAAGADPNSVWDFQPDEFQFNFNGYSGKFVLDSNYVARVTSTSNLKIVVHAAPSNSSAGQIGIIVITAPDGIAYTFGQNYEMTVTHNIQPFMGFKNTSKTAFFLDRIDLPNGDYAIFNYAPIQTWVSTGMTQTFTIGSGYGMPCVTCAQMGSYATIENRIQYNTQYLQNITTSNGLSINFTYASRPDLSNDNRLKGMEVLANNAGTIKKYSFNYFDLPSNQGTTAPSIIGRFFLTKLKEIDLTGDIIDTSKTFDYSFTYNQLAAVPFPLGGKQDYYGFYSGPGDETKPGSLIPQTTTATGAVDMSFRNPYPGYSIIGTLASIQYPSGGTETYTYEPNTIPQSLKRYTLVTVGQDGNGSPNSTPTYTSRTFNIKRDQTATLISSCANYILNDPYVADTTHKTVLVNVYDAATAAVVGSRALLGYGPGSANISLQAGHSYYFTLTVWDSHVRGSVNMTYDSSAADIYDNVNTIIPGLRVRKMQYTDSITGSTHSKYYTYASLNNLNVSTGSALPVIFHTVRYYNSYCSSGSLGTFETTCQLDVYSSSAMNDLYSYSGSGGVIYYNTVIESDDPNFSNGGTEYDFYGNDDGGNKSTVIGANIDNLPTGQFPTLAGKVYKTRVFDKRFNIVQDEEDDYETMIDLSNAVASYYIRENYPVNITNSDWHNAFDVAKMLYGNYWIRMKTKTENQYVGSSVWTQVTNYSYGTAANVLPSAITTTDSKGLAVRSEKKYPTDFPSDPYYAALTNKNIVIPVVQENHYRNGNIIGQKQTWYYDWFGDGKILEPKRVQVQLSPSDQLHDALLYNQYDRTGNPQQLQKANDMPMVYLWDSILSVPVCEIKNANFNQVAFCNFESANQWGNWQVVSGNLSNGSSVSGTYSFSGTLTSGQLPAGQYVVSAWSNSSVTVNGMSGNLVKTFRGWSLYEWKLTNPGAVVIQGSLDDVRLYPKGALLTSYTYLPHIGMTSQCDPNNRFSFYQYDGLGRLHIVLDQDGNILKTIDYHYWGH